MNVLAWTRKAIAAAFLVPLFFVYRLFVGERFYVHISVHPELGELSHAADAVLFVAMCVLLAVLLFIRRVRSVLSVFLVLSLVFSLWDQSRWMPYFYQFWFMILFLLSVEDDGSPAAAEEERVLNGLRCIVFGIWFWSGIHKVNA